MLEETTRLRTLCDNIGRSDFRGKYHSSEDSAEKHAQRVKAMEFIASHFGDHDPIRLLSMPGASWALESMILAAHENCHFVGIEQSTSVLIKGAPAMPSSRMSLRHKIPTYGSSHYQYFRVDTPRASRARSHRFLQMKSSLFMTLSDYDMGQSNNEWKKFKEKFYRRNAMWLDFTSGFCAEVDTTIQNMHRCMTRNGKSHPVIITLMYGRDISGGKEARERRVCELNPFFSMSRSEIYTGQQGCRMISIYGTITLPSDVCE